MKKALLSGMLLAVLAPLWAGTAAPAAAAQSSCDGVWVVVDFGSLGGTDTACAHSHGTGAAALRSAGFDPAISDGFVSRIAGKPSNPDPNKAYWSYWQATLKDDGSYSAWSYSNLGATASHPKKGNAEGWRYQSLSDGKVPPAIAPPKGEATKPTPKPTATTAKPTAKPSAKPTSKPTETKSATKSPSASATVSTSVSASATTSPTASASPTVTPTPSATPTAEVTPADEVTLSADEVNTTEEPAPDSGGSPVGAIAAGVVVVAAGAGLGGWWWLKGRKP